ncbi:hypothetical protein C7B77_24145 [Chamaesiphon polymorphus CCALA 037]|uniref:Peptidase M50 domain-containing protein n=1 Tax=Chamaesiphon polymorphus CCALA 037 TaxID=2107692 RepID=A0A2T1FSA0_9CYAN|nr:hypothetical protein C7B77_24145 [Chamaesiphon polymorphus CCALA 037]
MWLAVLWLAVTWGLRYGYTVIILLRARFDRMSTSVVVTEQVPEYVRDILEPSAVELQRLGFRDCGYLEYSPFQRLHPLTRWMRVMVDESGCHFASIELRYPVAATDPVSITFYTWFTDGHLLLSVDRLAHAIFGSIPNTTLGDNRIHNLERQWADRQQQFAQMVDRKPISNLSITDFSNRFFQRFSIYFDRLIATKVFVPLGNDNLCRLRLGSAIYYAYRLIYLRPKPQPLAQPIEIPSEIAIDNSLMLEQAQTSTGTRRSKFWWFGLSMVGFYVATIPYMGWQFGLQLLVVILLHELGHLLAMQFFGYRDTRMLFIPFLGGVAMGKNENATLSQKFWILILGPLPGILLGIAMLFIGHPNSSLNWLHGFGWLMVCINLLNLLPIYPLDGGKIISLLLQPYPYIGIGFKVICTAISIGLGLSGVQVFLFIGIAIALSLPLDLRTAKAISKLQHKSAPAGLEKDEWLQWAYTQFDRDSSPPMQPAQQKLFMNNLWEWKSDRSNSQLLRSGLGLLYAVSLIGGTIGSIYGFMGNRFPAVANGLIDTFQTGGMTPAQRKSHYRLKWQRELQVATAAIEKDPSDVEAYRQRFKLHQILKNYGAALQDLDRIIAIEPNNLADLHSRIFLNATLKDYRAALLDTDRILQLDPKSKADIYRQRGELYTQLGDTDLAIASYTQQLAESSNSDNYTYLLRAKLYSKKGETKLALADLDYLRYATRTSDCSRTTSCLYLHRKS